MEIRTIREKLFWIVIAAAAVVSEGFSLGYYRLNLVVLFVFYIGLKWGTPRAFLWAAVIGLVLDSMSLNIIGPNFFSKGTIVLLIYFIKTGIFNMNPPMNALLCAILTVLDNLMVLGSYAVFDTIPINSLDVIDTMVFQSVTNAIAVYFITEEDE